MPEYKPITLKEFVEEIQKGSRDFTYRTLTGSRNLEVAGLEELNNYLRSLEPAQLKESPVAISYSFFQGLKAHRIYLPHLRGIEARLQEADLRGADLKEANFWGADLWRADLRRANLYRTDLWKANLWRADLRGVHNLEYAFLSGESFRHTVVTKKEKAIIEAAMKRENLFIVKPLEE